MSTDIQKAKSVTVQKKIMDQFLQQRILIQKPLTFISQFPQEAEVIEKMADSG